MAIINLQKEELEIKKRTEEAHKRIDQIISVIDERNIGSFFNQLGFRGDSFKAKTHGYGNREESHYVKMKFDEVKIGKNKIRKRLKSLTISCSMIYYRSVCYFTIKERTKDGIKIPPRYDITRFQHADYWFDDFIKYLEGLRSLHDKEKLTNYKQSLDYRLAQLR